MQDLQHGINNDAMSENIFNKLRVYFENKQQKNLVTF